MPMPTKQCISTLSGPEKQVLGGYKGHRGNSKQPNWAGGEAARLHGRPGSRKSRYQYPQEHKSRRISLAEYY